MNSFKDFLSLTMKNIYPFNVFSIDTDLFHFKLRICEFLLLKFSKAQKELLVANILISIPRENSSPHYHCGFQVNPVNIGILWNRNDRS